MRNQITCFTIVFCLLQFACNRDQQNGFDFKTPKVIEAKSYVVPLEKMAPPNFHPNTYDF